MNKSLPRPILNLLNTLYLFGIILILATSCRKKEAAKEEQIRLDQPTGDSTAVDSLQANSIRNNAQLRT